jgi:integrase/recombinase XerD
MLSPDLNDLAHPVEMGCALAADRSLDAGGYFLAFSHLKAQGKPVTIGKAVEAYIQWIEAKRYSRWTVRLVKNVFSAFYRETALGRRTPIIGITEHVARHLTKGFTKKYKPGTTWRYLTMFMQIFRCFASAGLLPANPFAALPRPEAGTVVPLPTLSADEVRRLLEAPNLELPSGIRTRAFLELLSSTGLRLAECATLQMDDIDLARGVVRILGKGAQERLVPLSQETLGWLKRYLKEVRPRYGGSLKHFWVGQTGRPMNRSFMQKLIRKLGDRAGIEQSVSGQTIRRTWAALSGQGGPRTAKALR